ncbi:segregation/condensation protein A [Arthrobacter zhaoxinii]|uniref:Segregation and condensation protein A n=1 Tax=Arthrobacter zhaoxinii TaxID=2964616 RepID=A0ABY5YU77_9MICC|nr:ScpA family protein [Arthrobacter zhaoxinii]UWX98213.1 segregation/condensation protein A [Arthrobacter zhaoxinii]
MTAALPDAREPDPRDPDAGASVPRTGFEVRLTNFTGPFDVLLGLISKHELDITEIALAAVTDEFLGYIRELFGTGPEVALDEASEFLVIAATLLDLKAARLLPAGDVEDEEDVALLEARDLLFARLLQYKAFREMAALLGERLSDEAQRFPRQVSLDPHFAAMLPELIWRTTPEQFADLAARALQPRDEQPPAVGLEHLHAPKTSVREQALILAERLTGGGAATFAALVSDADGPVAVARFLALLELFRDGSVSFEQETPLGELLITWTGNADPETGFAGVDEYEPEPAGGEDRPGKHTNVEGDGHDG